MVEIESKEAFINLMNSASSISNHAFQGIDLNDYSELLIRKKFTECLFMGCNLTNEVSLKLIETGNFIFPKLNVPYTVFRNKMYDGQELYTDNLDQDVYQHYLSTSRENSKGEKLKGFTKSISESLARSLHDHGITDALEDFLENIDLKRVVAIMGGHGLERTNTDYVKIVQLSKELTEKGYILMSGGGPGAMEATHLGAWFAGEKDEKLNAALEELQQFPHYKDDNWLQSALDIIKKYPNSGKYQSIGIPTWLYGHEPASPFATKIAKYFTNAIREENLLALAKGGVVFAPGSAGTMQEIFQDACQNHYKSFEYASPMLFLNKSCWMRDKPVYNVLQRIISNGYYQNLYIDISDETSKLVSAIEAFQEGKLPKTEKYRINVGTFNVLNLVEPNTAYYGSKKYNEKQFREKTDWIAQQLDLMKADVVVFQEIFHLSALEKVLKKSYHFQKEFYVAIAERETQDQLLPMVAIASKYPIKDTKTYLSYEGIASEDFEIEANTFSRPILRSTIEIEGQDYVFFGAHLKSKRPNYSEAEKEERFKDAQTVARGTLRSLIKRGMEANGLRSLLLDSLQSGLPHFLMGDLNDSHNAVTNDIIGGNEPHKPQAPKYHLQAGEDKEEYDKKFEERLKKYHQKMEVYHAEYQNKLFQAKELLAHRSFQDYYFTHIRNGHHEALDHIYLSNDFSPFNPLKVGRVKQVKLFNDHLEDDTLGYIRNEFHESDHGVVVVKLELQTTQWK